MAQPHLLTIPSEVRQKILEYSVECVDAHLHPGDPTSSNVLDAVAQEPTKRWSFFFQDPKCDLIQRQYDQPSCEHLEQQVEEASDVDEELLGCPHIVKQSLMWTCEQLRAEFVEVIGKRTRLHIRLYVGHKHWDLLSAQRSLPAGMQDNIRKIELDAKDLGCNLTKPLLTMDFFHHFEKLEIVIIHIGDMGLGDFAEQDHSPWNDDGLESWLLLMVKKKMTECKEDFASEVPGRTFNVGILLRLISPFGCPSYCRIFGYTLVCCEVWNT